MIIAGLTGSIGHGKTTFANFLSQHALSSRHFETWELVAEVASSLRNEQTAGHPAPTDIAAINRWLEPLPEIVLQSTHQTISYTDIRLTDLRLQDHPERYAKLFEYLQLVAKQPELANIDITAENKEQFRPLLQWLGGYLVITCGSGVWYDELLRRIAQLQTHGLSLVTVGGVRYPGDAERLRNAGGVILEVVRPGFKTQDAQDITERDRQLITPDAVILNNSSEAALEACATRIYSDLQKRDLSSEYRAA